MTRVIEVFTLIAVGIIAVCEVTNVVMSIKDRYDFQKSWSYRHFSETQKSEKDELPFE